MRRWIPNIVLFFAINTANNFAFGYNISVPVHIILRSGGSVMTMIVGFIWGKRFTRMEVLSVCLLTFGVIMAAMADAQEKVSQAQLTDSLRHPSSLDGLKTFCSNEHGIPLVCTAEKRCILS